MELEPNIFLPLSQKVHYLYHSWKVVWLNLPLSDTTKKSILQKFSFWNHLPLEISSGQFLEVSTDLDPKKMLKVQVCQFNHKYALNNPKIPQEKKLVQMIVKKITMSRLSFISKRLSLPDQVVLFWALAGDIVFGFWARHNLYSHSANSPPKCINGYLWI